MYTLKKSLGQHFLRDENIARKIVASLDLPIPGVAPVPGIASVPGVAPVPDDPPVPGDPSVPGGHPFTRLLEVGPGGGALTKYLLELEGVDFKAVELDEEKIRYLLTTWPVLQGRILHASILELEKPFEGKFSVIGNFPYNISSQILFKLLDWKTDIGTVIGMFQKEVAQRLAAKEGSKTYGVLSVLIQAFFRVEYLFEVHEQCFNPPPKVKSAVIRLIPAAIPDFRDEKSFFLLVKTAFNQRRKTLRNAVKPLFDAEILVDPLFGQRAEQLTIHDFAGLTWKMKTQPPNR